MFTSEKAIPGRWLILSLMSGWKRVVLQMLAGLGVALALAGCEPVQSVYPFFEQEDALFDPALIGSWATEVDDGDQMKLHLVTTSPDKNEYTVDLIFLTEKPDEDKPKVGTVTFVVYLFQVGELCFRDFYPSNFSANGATKKLGSEPKKTFSRLQRTPFTA